MKTTVIPVLYRDASNYKVSHNLLASGPITNEQQSALRSALNEEDGYIPTQIGLTHLGPKLKSFPGEDDHPWHEMLVDEIHVTDKNFAGIPVGTVSEFVAEVVAASAAGWDDSKQY